MTSPSTPTPPEYPVGAVKRNPLTSAVAVRTNIIDALNRKDWGVMTVDQGGSYASWDDVSTWKDMTDDV